MTITQDARPAAPPRWMTGAHGEALAIIAAFTLLRLVICPVIGLGTNEDYAIAGGRLMSLSYFDHPPLHFWLAHLSELLFGDRPFVRVPFIALGAGTSYLMFRLTRRLFDERAAVWAVLTLNLSIFFSIFSGNWILPDGPLNFFLLATAWCVAPLAMGREDLTPARWLGAGLLLGMAALSKYHAIMFAGGFFLFLLSYERGRAILRTPWPWMAALAAVLVFSPVLYWNAVHDWASFRFQGGRAAVAHRIGIGAFFSLLGAQLALLSPWIAVILFQAVRRTVREGPGEPARLLLWLGLPTALFFSVAPLWSGGGMVQWAMPGWLMLTPLAGVFLAGQPAKYQRRWAVVSTLVFLVFVGLAAAEIQTGWLGDAFPGLFPSGDPTAEFDDWRPLAQALVLPGVGVAPNWFVLTFNWRDAAKIDQALDGRIPIKVISDDPRNFAASIDPMKVGGWNAVVVSRTRQSPSASSLVGKCFITLKQVPGLAIRRGRSPDVTLSIERGTDFLPSRCGG